MNDFFFARSQMAMSLAFHIVFAALGIGMPLLMAIAEGMYLRTRQPVYLDLSKRWAQGTAILFAVGAVSGTVLSFELGLLWPAFMEKAGAIIGMPFSLEGFAFFTEAIFLGVYLYGWNRLSPFWHWLSGLLVAVSGILSGIFVVTANAWMNAPAGFKIVDGKITDIDPIAAMLNQASFHEVLHMTLAAFVATGFAVARGPCLFSVARPEQSLSSRRAGNCAGRRRASARRCRFSAAISAPARWADCNRPSSRRWKRITGRKPDAPLLIGGIPNDETRTTDYAIRIPHGLSLLLTHKLDSKVTGLEEFPRSDWPNVRIVHWSFDLMVGCGMALFAVVGGGGLAVVETSPACPIAKWFLRGVVACGPLGFVAIEAGWVVTEVGRQPWIIYGVMRTEDAVTPMRWIAAPFAAFTVLYIFLAVVVVFLLRRQFLQTAARSRSFSHFNPCLNSSLPFSFCCR